MSSTKGWVGEYFIPSAATIAAATLAANSADGATAAAAAAVSAAVKELTRLAKSVVRAAFWARSLAC